MHPGGDAFIIYLRSGKLETGTRRRYSSESGTYSNASLEMSPSDRSSAFTSFSSFSLHSSAPVFWYFLYASVLIKVRNFERTHCCLPCIVPPNVNVVVRVLLLRNEPALERITKLTGIQALANEGDQVLGISHCPMM